MALWRPRARTTPAGIPCRGAGSTLQMSTCHTARLLSFGGRGMGHGWWPSLTCLSSSSSHCRRCFSLRWRTHLRRKGREGRPIVLVVVVEGQHGTGVHHAGKRQVRSGLCSLRDIVFGAARNGRVVVLQHPFLEGSEWYISTKRSQTALSCHHPTVAATHFFSPFAW